MKRVETTWCCDRCGASGQDYFDGGDQKQPRIWSMQLPRGFLSATDNAPIEPRKVHLCGPCLVQGQTMVCMWWTAIGGAEAATEPPVPAVETEGDRRQLQEEFRQWWNAQMEGRHIVDLTGREIALVAWHEARRRVAGGNRVKEAKAQ